MRCINTVNQKDIENICVQDSWKYMVKCTCNNLIGGTEYKITFITRKQNWDDAIFENIARQSTGKIFFCIYNLNKIGYLIILFII